MGNEFKGEQSWSIHDLTGDNVPSVRYSTNNVDTGDGPWTQEWFEEAEQSVKNLRESRKTIEELNDLYETRFRGKNTDG